MSFSNPKELIDKMRTQAAINQAKNQANQKQNTMTTTARTQADPIAANEVISQLKLAGLPDGWFRKFAESVKTATNGADNPAFSDWSMVRELLIITMPRSSQQLVAVNCVMELLQAEKGTAPGGTPVLANVLGGNDESDVVAQGARAYSLDQLAVKFGAALPKLNELIEEALFGASTHVLAVKELPDGTVVAELVKKPKP